MTDAQTLTLSDRPELRIDPTTLISTGAIAGVPARKSTAPKPQEPIGSLYLQGEYFWFNVDRGFLGLPSLNFQGGYAQAGYILTGETRAYNPASASYGGVMPATRSRRRRRLGRMGNRRPLQHDGSQRSAWRRHRHRRRKQNVYTAALNWYVNRNVRFMLNYLHGDVAKQISATSRQCRFEVRCGRDADAVRILALRLLNSCFDAFLFTRTDAPIWIFHGAATTRRSSAVAGSTSVAVVHFGFSEQREQSFLLAL